MEQRYLLVAFRQSLSASGTFYPGHLAAARWTYPSGFRANTRVVQFHGLHHEQPPSPLGRFPRSGLG